MLRKISILLLALFFSNSVYAKTFNETVSANRITHLRSYAVYSEVTCYYETIFDMKLAKKPEHGKVTFKKIRRKFGKTAGYCKEKNAIAILVSYRPNNGFRGSDVFEIRYSYSTYDGGPERTFVAHKYNISVK